jgi:hypothetical protein
MQITRETMKQMFPKTRKNGAQFGLIPIQFFNEHETEIRKLMNTRIIYRGPRRVKRVRFAFGTTNVCATRTLRSDATHALVY